MDKYQPPYTMEEIKKNKPLYYEKLKSDPVHNWRASNGIELIHEEPTEEELDRIWHNWSLMSTLQKLKSDKKSRELFGMDNKSHYMKLKEKYKNDPIPKKLYRVTYNGIGIYEALRKKVSKSEWDILLQSKDINWLPKPKTYPRDSKSYFTEEGFSVFTKKTLPIIIQYLDKNNIKIEESNYDSKSSYKDKYQIIY